MSALLAGTIDRRLSALLTSRASEEPVIALHGPRSVGKSTVLRAFAERAGSSVLDLDDPAVQAAVASNPTVAVSTPAPVCIDEYQHVIDVLDALKARLNRQGSLPGTAVLTGSTRQDALPRTAQALTGRLHSMTIWPLSQGEIGGVEENLLESLHHNPVAAVDAIPASTTTRAEYVDRVCAGGFPLALKRTAGASRNRWFDDYVRQSVERDAVELARIQQREALGKLLDRLAGRTGQVLNLTNAGEGLGLSLSTLQDYATLLEDLFLIERLPAWGKTLRKRAVSSPKLHVIDSGVAARLMRIGPEKLATLEPTALTEFGNLLETFVVGELRKQASWLDEPVTLGHWRTHDDDEVDYVVEFADGGVLAFEIKANEKIGKSDFKGMHKLRDALGDRFIAGIGFITGTRSYSGYDDRIHVMPVDRLWQRV